MSSLLRKHFWTLELACLALAGALAAQTINTCLAAGLDPQVDVDAIVRGRTETGRRVSESATLSVEATAAIFGVALPPPSGDTPTPDQLAHDPEATPAKSSLRLVLVGTMVADHPSYSFAAIRCENGPQTGLFMVGDRILTAQVQVIERKKVILLNGGRSEYIAMGDVEPAAATDVSAGGMTEAPDSGDRSDDLPIDCSGDSCSVPRGVVQSQLANMNALAAQARIVPVANGFKLVLIRPGSIYSRIGIMNGDVIRRINGYEIDSPDKALEVYARLKESSRIEIELERRGQPVKKSISIP